MSVLLMGGNYKLSRCDGLRCLDTHTKFHKDWFSHSKTNRRNTYTDADTHREQGDLIRLLSFLAYFPILKK
jgi:hypothetical protein